MFKFNPNDDGWYTLCRFVAGWCFDCQNRRRAVSPGEYACHEHCRGD